MFSDRLDKTRDFMPLNIAVLTVSDTRGLDEDRSGATLVARLEEAGHGLADRQIIVDEVDKIQRVVQSWIDDEAIDVVISTGGTGLTGRDVTPEAFKPLFEKEIEGFSFLFHKISYEKIGTSTIQSRACAGVAKGTYMFVLPGSTGAVKDGWDEILKWQLDYRLKPCNFVEMMPRLREHEDH
jgi:molybdopterin adenylyltransferase